ncbi:hypothetical protein T492DRAFT_973847 [Pavlovales sp. CCMP2436]|nr:hypothetical protein T492DRAFT_973847 [Pavlovales sp. CCMP2436]
MAVSKRQLVGALSTVGAVLVTVGLVALASTPAGPSAALASAPAAGIEKAVEPRFKIQSAVSTAFWGTIHQETKYVIVDLARASEDSPLEFKVVSTAEDADLSGDQRTAWAHMLGQLPLNDCRYGLFDFTYIAEDGTKAEKIVLATSRTCSNDPRQQMDITYGISDLLNIFNAIDISFMAKLPEQLEYEQVLSRVEACVERDEGCISSAKGFFAPQ